MKKRLSLHNHVHRPVLKASTWVLLLGLAACREVRPLGASCSISVPEGSPVRFVECAEGAQPRVLAIVTPGSHCVSVDAGASGTVSCDDGTELRLGDNGACALRHEGGGFAACVF